MPMKKWQAVPTSVPTIKYGPSEEQTMPELPAKVLKQVRTATTPQTLADLARAVGQSPEVVREAVWYLLDRGDVALDRDWRVSRAHGAPHTAAGASSKTR